MYIHSRDLSSAGMYTTNGWGFRVYVPVARIRSAAAACRWPHPAWLHLRMPWLRRGRGHDCETAAQATSQKASLGITLRGGLLVFLAGGVANRIASSTAVTTTVESTTWNRSARVEPRTACSIPVAPVCMPMVTCAQLHAVTPSQQLQLIGRAHPTIRAPSGAVSAWAVSAFHTKSIVFHKWFIVWNTKFISFWNPKCGLAPAAAMRAAAPLSSSSSSPGAFAIQTSSILAWTQLQWSHNSVGVSS